MWPYLPEHALLGKTAVWIELDFWVIEYRHGKSKNRIDHICNLISNCSKKYTQIPTWGVCEREW